MEVWLIWLIATAILIIIELISGMVASFCLAIGCLAAMIVSALQIGMEIQLTAFAIATVLSFIFIAPVVKKWQNGKNEKSNTQGGSNMDALIGRVVDVIQEIPCNGIGRIRIDGDNWQARSISNEAITAGSKVKVVSYESIIIEVEKVN